jgi:hypothetical protein
MDVTKPGPPKIIVLYNTGDVILSLNEGSSRLLVSSTVLVMASTAFKAMFQSGFSES